MNEEFALSYFQQTHPHFPIEEPMSPRYSTSAASTPPIISATCDASLASFTGPVSISTAHFSLPLPTLSVSPPRRQDSFANFYPHQLMGAPPAPKQSLLIPTGSAPSASISLATNGPDAAPSGTGGSQRKRPKYTRSKKGCLTCRSKKIKCDERRPNCTRCEHGHRECTWPEAVLPRRPKGAMRGVGNEDEEDEEDGRPMSMPSSAVSTQFPTSATSAQFPPYSPFEPAPNRDAYDSDIVYGAGPSVAQFAQAMPILDAPSRGTFYQRSSVASASGISPAAPSNGSEFYPLTTTTAAPSHLDEYEYPPRQQQFNSGGSRGSYSNGTGGSGVYSNGSSGASYSNGGSYSNGTPGNWNDGRRPSWDATSVVTHASSVSSPATSALGLGLSASRAGGSVSAGSSAGGNSSGGGLMLFQSPDPLSPFFRSVQERNLVGNFSSSCFSSFSSNSSFDSSSSLSPFSSSYSLSSSAGATPALTSSSSVAVSPISVPTSSASTTPTLSLASPFCPPQSRSGANHLRPLTIDPPVSLSISDIDRQSSTLDCDSSSLLHHPPRWHAPSSSLDGSEFPSWNVYS